jgi:hypothetical protein
MKKLAKSPLPGGDFRWYGVFNIPKGAGGETVRLRLNQIAGGRAQKPPLGREEHLACDRRRR